MTYIPKPKVHHPDLPRNALGLTQRDYEGVLSTLCAGCGHDSITAAIIQACFELSLAPHTVAKTGSHPRLPNERGGSLGASWCATAGGYWRLVRHGIGEVAEPNHRDR